jgi:type VI secretion system protein ImpA
MSPDSTDPLLSSPMTPLLTPLSDAAPCGDDLGQAYDPAFVALEAAAQGKPEREYGDKVYPAEPPDWRAVHEQALQVAARTRDLRVAVLLVRSGARVAGLQGAVQGLRLVHGLLAQHWDHVHPQLDASEGNDPTARLNALAPLTNAEAGLADLRAAALTGARGSLTVRAVELAYGGSDVEPQPDETVPTKEGVLQALTDAVQHWPDLGPLLQDGAAQVKGIVQQLDQHLGVGAGAGADFIGLGRLLRRLADLGLQVQGAPVPDDAAAGAMGGAAGDAAAAAGRSGGAATGPIASREDASRALDRVCEWLERAEPTNPAPLLIRRAQRLMTMNFLDIIRDVVPGGLEEVTRLAGVSGE